ncbi:2',3'-cyclic-nucleotide 2'-phosphodiesterase/3'-nucleotidase/5'-nucleotidase [Enterococcus sp. PF1-24]|uniref:5'-nucleotidase C-terminal domain-containing protein n=1 Tax=unclassified Enterococcus TaxID=2608891 RepID=UPI002476C646|nr:MULTISPECIES: 5'-nucleotidase C-terminal domain-containing protein [unclassified Enterococcus]MDH6363426.1 2',3'-cyclic-nucleotide 2'-phosphodiesterase/3'-nucleotidase/5'-nucleotidase [Enterococcus sp. PFB1-1]MDH6400520.1 2',3'-cyclic-nucleotide 2'-phosphodiesterase/3'-nucleotidase/5'-nucleotidase [Enterococcus sp. PF1-24]
MSGKNYLKKGLRGIVASALAVSLFAPTALATEAKTTANKNMPAKTEVTEGELTILGTSDVHGQLWNWSYEDDKETPVGLSQISTVVKETRAENPRGTVLIDNGDITQGTIMTDDIYNKTKTEDANPMIAAMNYMGYDSMTLGNHEFNFGLDLIKKIQTEAEFPILAGNVYQKDGGERFVQSTTTKEMDLDGDGDSDLTVGILGLVTPHIPHWDGAKVESLTFNALKEEAEKSVAELKAQDADIIVASIHAGREDKDPAASANEVIENVAGIDAYILGHDHSSYALKVEGPNGEVPVAGPKDTGTEMIRIDLDVEKKNDQWQVVESGVEIVSTTEVAADEELKELTKEYHETTREFIAAKIGEATADFLPPQEVPGIPEAQLRPTAMISLINNVQREVTGAQLAASALFKADSEFPAGDLTYSNVFDIYKYPNTLVSVEITGEKLLEYMENQAAYYQTPQADDLTIAFNENIRVYNYDIFSGIDYKIDISKPVGNRIVNPTIDGEAVDLAGTYTIAMNNYRYEGLLSQGIVTGEPIVTTDPETLRGLITDYIREKETLVPAEEIENNWEVIGYEFDTMWRNAAIQLVKDEKLTIEPSFDGRTPNVKAITKEDVIKAGGSPIASIMHTNDIHGRLEGNSNDVLGMARLKTYKEQLKPTLMLDMGDAFQGLPISNYSEGADMAAVMNAIGYDAMIVGNHEFDFGIETAAAYAEKLNFPILSANTYKDGERIFDAYTIVEKDGYKYAVIGLTTPETATKTHPKNIEGVTFAEPLDEAKKVMAELADQEIDLYVVAAHLGVDETTPKAWRGDTLAEELSKAYAKENIVVLDGHSHTEVDGGLQFGNVLYSQTGNYLNNVGMVTASIEDPAAKSAHLVKAANLQTLVEEPAVKKLVDQAKATFEEWGATTVIDNNPYLLNGERDNVRTRETNLGNLIGDAMYYYGQTGFENGATDFAMTNGGGIRANIEAGEVTLGDIIAVLPFGNSISQIKVTGAQVQEMFEMSLRSMAQTDESGAIVFDDFGQPKLGANGGFLHVSSSIRVYYDSTKAGSLLANDKGNETGKSIVGERVLAIEIQNRETGEFEALNPEKEYRMATNDFLAAGGDGYDMLGGEREEGPSLDTVLIEYLQAASQLRVYDAKTNIDLAQYEAEFPNSRIVSISEADFKKLAEPKMAKAS